MLFNKPLTEHDEVWRDWAVVACLWLFALGCFGGNALDFQRFKYVRLALSGMSAISAGLGVAKVRQIERRSPYYSQREVMRNDLFIETQAQQIPSLQPKSQQQAALMPANDANPQNSGLYAWERLLWEAVGIIIAGNSGSGKTSVACFLLGLLTQDKPKKIIVCDPHFNKIWQQLGLTSIGRIRDIERQLIEYVKEMDSRYDALADGHADFEPMVIVLDELGKCQSKFVDPTFIEEAIARLGCEGRKVGMTAIIICHSQNVEDMGISKKLRNNYALILLGASALDEAEKWKAGDEKRLFVESQSYPCMLSGSVRNSPALHPTHHQYQQYRIQGNQPLNLLPINQIHGGDRPPISLDKSDTPPDIDTIRTQWLNYLYSLNIQPIDTQTQGHNQAAIACPQCQSTDTKGNGFYKGQPRRRCKSCGKSWS